MTRQKWEVLWYFVVNTGASAMPSWTGKCGILIRTDAGESRFYSYPSRIHEDFGKSYSTYGKSSISKDWAGKICEDLCELGILGSEMIRAPRQSGKTPHYYLMNGYEPFLRIMKYFFRIVTQPGMQRLMMNSYIQEHTDAGLVRYILHKKGVEIERDIQIREWDAHEAPQVFEHYFRGENKNQKSDHPCSFAAYIQEQASCSPAVSLRLPVFPDDLSDRERLAAIELLNRPVFENHAWLKRYRSGILEHYGRYEYEHWILPILALIRASPVALEEFLFGKWEPYSGSLDYPFFNLLFTAVWNLAMVRDVGDDSLVERVSFRPEAISPDGRGSALLEVELKNDLRTLYYDGSFNTDQRWITISERDAIQPARETNYSFRSWVTFPTFEPGGVWFSPDDLSVILCFLRHLWVTPTPGAREIFGRLSHVVQNTVATPGNREIQADSPIGRAILRDMNELLMCDNLYAPGYFPDLHLTKDGEQMPGKDLVCNSLRGDHNSIHREFFNRELLERAFPGMMPAREQLATQYFS